MRVSTELVDLQHASWDAEKWDQIICVYGHFPKALQKSTLESIRQALKPGGYYLTEVYSEQQLAYKTGGPSQIEWLYTPEQFLEVFKGWKFMHFFWGEVTRNEGVLHNGLAHVIQVAVQKPH